jgi:two-component system phosphate regulon sensor histidine kinase PhoR
LLWSSRLFWRIFAVFALFDVLFVAALIGVIRWRYRAAMVDQEGRALVRTLDGIESRLPKGWLDLESDELERWVNEQSQHARTELTLYDSQGLRRAASLNSGEKRIGEWPEVVQARTKGVGQSERLTSNSEHRLYAAKVLSEKGVLQGTLCSSTSLTEIDRSISQMVWGLSGIGILAAMAVAGVSYLTILQTIRPLAALARGARGLAGNDQGLAKEPERSDELGLLGNLFRQMQSKLDIHVDQLNANSERLKAVLENMVEGVIAVGPDERILLANEASRELLEIAPGDISGRSLLEVTRSLAMHKAVGEALQGSSAIQREFESTGKQRRVLALRATRLPGNPSPGVMVVLHDVTELRRLENLRREFVANVSHELKTPLASIKAYAETLRLGAIADSVNNVMFVERIEEQADRLHQLIMDLIHIARVESGQEVFEIVDVDLGTVIEACVHSLRGAASAKHISLTTEGTEEEVLARADEEGMETILNNLIGNAIKYTPDEGSVVVRCRREGRLAIVEVEDTGIGIAPPEQSRIFERFYRVDKARSRELGGTGLGLSIVKNLTQAFGGSIGLESQLKKGSKFIVRLPLVESAQRW